MGYLLEMYALDWGELRRTFGAGNHPLRDRVVHEVGPRLLRAGSGPEDRLLWRKVVDAFLLGPRGRVLADALRLEPPPEVETVSDLAALAVAGIIQGLGERVGELEHSTQGGEMFRDEFLAVEAPRLLRTRTDFLPLLHRPFFGLAHEEFPSWGGLSRAEVAAALMGMGAEAQIEDEDEDFEGWSNDLLGGLQAAQASGKDLVSLYL